MAVEGTVNLDFLDGVEHPTGEAPPEDDNWFTNNSPASHYFDRVKLPDHSQGVLDLVWGQIGYDNVGIDLAGGSNGRAITDLSRSDIVVRGLLTNYRDNRDMFFDNRSEGRIDHIEGDLIRPGTWQRIIEWQRTNAPNGAGIVMWRPDSAMQHLPPSFYQGAAHQVLDMIRPGGVFFTQVPVSLRPEWPTTHDKDTATQELGKLCTSISDREDVAEVLVSEQLDRKEHCALIIKS